MTLVKNPTEQIHIQNIQTPDHCRARIKVVVFLSLFPAFTNVVQVTSSQGSQPCNFSLLDEDQMTKTWYLYNWMNSSAGKVHAQWERAVILA